MSKFKFRIWHKKENRWIDPWSEEDPIISLKDFGHGCNVYLYDRKINGFTDLNCQMEDLVIQQFTGLKDVDGVDIYEGDFIEFIPDVRNFLNDNCIHSNWGHIWFYSLALGATISFNHPHSEYSMSWTEILRVFYSSEFRKEIKCEFLDFKLIGNIFEGEHECNDS